MIDPIEIHVRFFGVFRKFSDGSETRLQVPKGCTLREFKEHLARHLGDRPGFDPRMVEETMFANEERIYRLTERLDGPCTIATLPPVCGG